MGYARHVGRVGALAVALGVGVAVASTPGIASAAPAGDSSSDSSSSSAASGTSSSGTSGGTSGGTSSARAASGSSKPAEGPSGGSTSTSEPGSSQSPSDESSDGDDAADSDDPADTPATGDTTDEASDDADANAPTEAVDPSTVEPAVVEPVVSEPSGTAPVSAEPPSDEPAKGNDSNPQPEQLAPAQPAGPVTAEAPETSSTAPVAVDVSAPVQTVAPSAMTKLSTSQPSTQRAATTTTSLAATAPVVPQQPRTLITAVTQLVAAVLQPLLDAAKNSPIQIPFLSAALSLVRNEFERILGPRQAAPQQGTTLVAEPTKQRVLVIGIDGTNLSRILADDYNQNFLELMGTSTTAASSIVGHTTISNPSWTAILTGVWGERTGVINNVFTPWTYNTWPTVFTQLESIDRDIQTMTVANWNVINGIAGAGAIPVDENLYVAQLEGDRDWLLTDDAVADLTVDAIAGADAPNFLFSYFVGVDENGHMYGGASQQYKDAIRNMDDNLGEMMDAVAARELATGEDWTIMVVTDHGHQPQVGFGHGFQSPDETATFVIVDGPDFKDGYVNLEYEIVDTTPTVVSLFGGTPRAGSDGVTLQSLAAGDELPDDLVKALQDAIADNDYPDLITNIALGARTVFATVPYYVLELKRDLGAGLPNFLLLPFNAVFDGLYVATNVPAQIVAFLTGVTGARIFPLLPPEQPDFAPTPAPTSDAGLLACGSVSEMGCTTAA
ncbi:alkaline phosphatase family protein [Mycolicibacterium lacusdiani]|uniref:alkaline phosphatase family protein n=1 Tax=Mycolicibacterium lacusdiani TaxID=2895283 RepID=UPI0024C065AF|nr:alkaline phosphatase family protein [Mycolicibacterium lacusdiani]